MKNIHERTLIIFKPDSVSRGIVGEILSRFEKVGLKIVGAKMLQPDTAAIRYEVIRAENTSCNDCTHDR